MSQLSRMEPPGTIPSPSEDNNENLSKEDHPNVSNDVDDVIQKHDNICKFYTKYICRFGKEGKDCKFKHPVICKAYQKHGRNPGKGCQTFKNCGLYHPKRCEGFGIKCIDLQCKKLHLKGTRRHPLKGKPSSKINTETVNPHTNKKDELQHTRAKETHQSNIQTSDTTPVSSPIIGMQKNILELQQQMANLLSIVTTQVPT